jgi:hypothetical protein
MTEKWIHTMQQTKRLKLSWWDSVNHFFIVPFLLFIPALTVYSLYQIYISHTYTGVRTASEMMWVNFPWIAPAILFYFIQKRALKFKEIKINNTAENFKEAVKRTARQLEWNIENCNIHFARTFRPWSWTGSWGEMITIIRTDNSILINSICDPNKPSSVTSCGWNKKNVNIFLANLNDVVSGVPEKIIEEEKLPANEWTFKRTLLRIIIYPFCVFLIVLGVYMIIEPVNYRTPSAGLGAIVIATVYLYSDLKILLMKKQT